MSWPAGDPARVQFVGRLVLEDDLGLPYTLVEPLQVQVSLPNAEVEVNIPAGFRTDLASIPRGLWNLLPKSGPWDKAAVLHDYLYNYNGCSRGQADLCLLRGMETLGVGRVSRKLIYAGVRAGGWKSWASYRAKDQGTR